MRKALFWLPLLLLPPLAAAQDAKLSKPVVRILSVAPTQTVSFDGSLPQLQARLEITDAQQAAWARYSSSVDAYTKLFFEEKQQSHYPDDAAPRQLERMNARMKNRLDALQRIETRANELYAVLTPAQQKIADQHLMASIPAFGFLPPTP